MESKQVVQALGALAHPLRLQAFRALVEAGGSGLTPGTLTGQLNLPAATLSFHLRELHLAGLVSQERNGRHLIYRADIACMNALLGYLTANCCQGQPCELAPTAEACDC